MRRLMLLALAALAAALLGPSAALASLVFVVNQDDATICAIDTRSDTVVATIPVGFAPASIAASRDGGIIDSVWPIAKSTALSVAKPRIDDARTNPRRGCRERSSGLSATEVCSGSHARSSPTGGA